MFASNFVHAFGRVLSINVLFFSEITLRIHNFHNAKLQVRILQLHIVICYVMLLSKQLFPNLLEKLEVELRKIDT